MRGTIQQKLYDFLYNLEDIDFICFNIVLSLCIHKIMQLFCAPQWRERFGLDDGTWDNFVDISQVI